MCWLFKKFKKKSDRLPTKLLMSMREDAAFKIRLCRTRKTWPNYGIYKMYFNGEFFYPGELMEKISEEQVKNNEAKRILKEFQRDYIMNTLIKEKKIQYEQYGVKI